MEQKTVPAAAIHNIRPHQAQVLYPRTEPFVLRQKFFEGYLQKTK